jgi:hypothetical protein
VQINCYAGQRNYPPEFLNTHYFFIYFFEPFEEDRLREDREDAFERVFEALFRLVLDFDFDLDFDFEAAFFFGTFAPFALASLSPIAIACFRLFTVCPEPLLSVPFFLRCIALSTVSWAFFPYFAIVK